MEWIWGGLWSEQNGKCNLFLFKNHMIGKDFSFRNQKISITTSDFQIGLTALNWKNIDYSDSQAEIQGSHDIKVSPTYRRGRRISIEGVIIADTREGRSKATDYLDDLFALQGVVDELELLPFQLTDEQGRVRIIDAKIKEPIQYSTTEENEYLEWADITWRVVLQAPDSRFFSIIEEHIAGSEGTYWGMKLKTKLKKQMNLKLNEIICSTLSPSSVPMTFRIVARAEINAPLKIKKNTGELFSLNINASAGDVILIDSKNKTATKNGENVLAEREPGSTWLTIEWTNRFTVFDVDGGLYSSDFDVDIYFRNILI